MPAEGELQMGHQLDRDHAPETNGRMSVCRRCGSQTDGPEGGHHLPTERQMTRIAEWLVAEAQRLHLQRVRQARGG